MKRKRFSFIAIFIPLSYILLVSYASVNLTPQASKVEIISEERAQNYEFIGYVRGTSLWTGVARDKGYENAVNEMLNNAASIGANYVVIISGKPTYWTTKQIVTGKAYRARNQ